MSTKGYAVLRRRAIMAGATIGLVAVAAFGAFLGASSVAAYLGSSGGDITIRFGPGQGASGIDHNKLVVFASEDTGFAPLKITGSLDYQADNTVAVFNIDRVKFSVRDTTSPMNPWTVVCDVTAPDVRIVNGTPINTFQDTFTVGDLQQVEFAFEVWDDATDAKPEIVMSGAAK